MRRLGIQGLAFTLLFGCKPDLGDSESRIVGSRILAIKADPPEVVPGSMTHIEALVVDQSGTLGNAALSWAMCRVPKPLTENNSVSRACLLDGVESIPGGGSAIDATVPVDACSLFGPDTPPGDYRPRDADATGGYYQPIRAEVDSITAIALERITCNLPDAPIDVAIDYQKHYRANKNPSLTPLVLSLDGSPMDPGRIPSGKRLRLEVGWAEGDAENYLAFDPTKSALVTRREALRVAWFATGGDLSDVETGRDESDLETSTSTTWLSPEQPQVVHLWVVLRDSRGGVDFAGHELTVVQ